jgi:putative ABC transport system permease protein
VFGGTALVLAVIRLYGLSARRVADRRHELGVRAAMGASPRDLSRLVIRDGVKTLAAGLFVGLPAAVAASLVLRSFLFGVSATSARVFLTAFAVIAVAALLAMAIPARRAGRVDVMETLRT